MEKFSWSSAWLVGTIGGLQKAPQLSRGLLLSLLLLGPLLACADDITWSAHSYPKFYEAIIAAGPEALVYTDDKAPRYVLTRFVIEGSSTEQWTEAMELLNTQRKDEPKNVKAWYDRFKSEGDEHCQSDWQILSESKKALMFERRSGNCPPFAAQHSLYHVLYGKSEVFVFIATRTGEMDAATREGWLGILQSAEIKR
jgi:hypothetical protein